MPTPETPTTGSTFEDLIPRMRSESELEVIVEDVPPVRPSGFISLFLGVASFAAPIGRPALILPALAIVFGLFALRKREGLRAVGTTPAIIGLILASFFGACGIAVPWMKSKTMGDQATYFASQFLELASRGEESLVKELQREFRNRHITTTKLDEVYQDESAESAEAGPGIYDQIFEAGPDVDFVLDRPVQVFQRYGNEKVDTVWTDRSGKIKQPVQIEMQWIKDPDGNGQWHVSLFQFYREPIYAESNL